jgi:hypothetical protein
LKDSLKIDYLAVGTAATQTEKGIAYRVFNQSGEEVSEYFVAKTPIEKLDEFKPSKLEAYFNQLKKTKAEFKTGAFYFKKFPLEVMKFFVALGALAAKDLIFNYNSNPLVVSQFVQNQENPVGQLGFLAFMMANGIAAEPLMAALQSSRLRMFIPYFGMSIGMTANNIIGELNYIDKENLAICYASLKKNIQACDKALSTFLKRDAEARIEETIPSWLSMLLSTAAAGVTMDLAIPKTAGLIAKGAKSIPLFSIAFEIATWAAPGGVVVKGVKFATEVSKLAGWLWFDDIFRIPATFLVRNAWDVGPEIKKTKQKIQALLEEKKKNGWKPLENSKILVCIPTENPMGDCTEQEVTEQDLPELLARYNVLAKKWADANMIKNMNRFQVWQSYVTNLSQWYNATKKVYSSVFDYLYNEKYEYYETDEQRAKKNHTMDRIYPLYGVNAKGYNFNPTDSNSPSDIIKVFVQPRAVEGAQLATLIGAGSFLADALDFQNPNANSKFEFAVTSRINKERASKLKKNEIDLLKYLSDIWISGNMYDVGRSLDLLNSVIRTRQYHGDFLSEPALALLNDCLQIIGHPEPKWLPMQGFVEYLKYYFSKTADLPPVPGVSMMNRSTVEYLISQMLLGPRPEKGEKIVQNNRFSGFPSEFIPPAVTLNTAFATRKIKQTDDNSMFGYEMILENKPTGKNMVDAIVKDLINPGILGSPYTAGKKFQSWWQEFPEAEYFKAWIEFENRYEDFAFSIYDDLFGTESNGDWKTWLKFSNSSGQPNAVLASLEADLNFNLNVIHEATADLPNNRADELRNQIFEKFRHLISLLSRIKWQKVSEFDKESEKTILISDIPNQEFQKIQNEAADLYKEYLDPKYQNNIKGLSEFGKNYADLFKNKKTYGLKHETIAQAFKNIDQVFNQLSSIAQAINAVSYQQNHTSKGFYQTPKCTDFANLPPNMRDQLHRTSTQGCPN